MQHERVWTHACTPCCVCAQVNLTELRLAYMTTTVGSFQEFGMSNKDHCNGRQFVFPGGTSFDNTVVTSQCGASAANGEARRG